MAAPPPRTPSRMPRMASKMIRASAVMVPRIGTGLGGAALDRHLDWHVRSGRDHNLQVLIGAASRDAGVRCAKPVPAAVSLYGLGLRSDERVGTPAHGRILPARRAVVTDEDSGHV